MEQRTRSASEVIAGTKERPRCFDARLVRDRTDALWGIDVGIPEDSTQLLVKAVCGAKARPPLRNGDRIVAIDGASCAEVADLSHVLPWTCSLSTGAPSRRVLMSSCGSTCAAPTAMHRRRCSPRRTTR